MKQLQGWHGVAVRIVSVGGKRQGRVSDIVRINDRSYFKEAAAVRFTYQTDADFAKLDVY